MSYFPGMSPKGFALIKQFQGFSPEPYQDECNLWVIGYGHVIQQGESFATPLSHAQADALLLLDIHICQSMLMRTVNVALTQHQYDALVSLAYSIGPQTLASSALLRHINQRQFAQALALWRSDNEMNGVNSNGLNKQRQAECALFETGLIREIISAE